ncbi:hypothetical protein A3D66_02105 [Candidatus Kaiserbacteria bacterium RIFCSPHIGHO2_02_FULL_50_9]|uniref:Uncharacterized protein n=1 Tax=Candidatus Kaiserbacteria bacterium RIFCSPLOWO2_01_FULL_51_21 TaxID=1798508 RepID=A0A1F6EE38_9BACT|nr:MAG: hypothetical protein A3D66_02105 [Candidatus Kaiserbacteria bacterium RIFCSPHIGHO2_02_FULL_50_9]OGG71933.1 MAG: hypothetical protein A3A35_02455 [Candidatus Kaiserbacteria bacterium RIFCSPLOWO2_01_FULL_51_21]
MYPDSQLQTIFITSFHGLVSRVLACGLLEKLTADKLRVVLFVPDFKKDYFVATFGFLPNLVIEGVSRELLPRRTRFFQNLTLVLLDTETMRLTRRSFRGYHNPFKRFVAQSIASGLGRFRFVRESFRFINYLFSADSAFAPYFAKYRPALVFSTDVKHILDAELLIAASHRSIRTVAMVRSWDYLTGKGMIRVRPDWLVVHNNVIRDEAVMYADMPVNRIFVSGLPHFDPYVNVERSPREEFFKKIGGDSGKRLLLYIPWGDKFSDSDGDFLNMITNAIEKGKLPDDLQILVRLPPGDSVAFSGLRPRPNLIIEAPGKMFGSRSRKANEMTYEDLLHLADSIYWSDIIVSPPSTVPIDAAAFDKPVVMMAFDGYKDKGYYGGIRHSFDFCHIKKLTNTHSTAFTQNEEELVRAIDERLKDPTLDSAGRERLRQEQVYKLDGKSSERLADFLRTLLEERVVFI